MRSNITRELFKEALDAPPKDKKKIFKTLKRGITLNTNNLEKKIVKTGRHTRSLSNDLLAGESEADINY